MRVRVHVRGKYKVGSVMFAELVSTSKVTSTESSISFVLFRT